MEIFNARRMTRIGVTAALYVVITLLSSGIAYREVQFRIAEALMLLCLFNKDFVISLTLGCFLANLASPLGLMDVVFGTAATFVAALPMYLLRKKINMPVASLFPVVSNGIIVAAELKIAFGSPFFLSMLSVAAGELVCVTILGVAIFSVLKKNKPFMHLLTVGSEESVGG